ncbi:Glycosyltransferase, catalytic subunit of cellulose synthase and poly-beta-1,6-N-acetylglucosamine synthase [Prevotellaceae bacterium HUN156]|nr:Glycosyltransferase, catalytic subunit of cellulose synthase and poly-beta-1,6-N-acetylglucosamine synthase [Prevotellaceae bacterium HUN156]
MTVLKVLFWICLAICIYTNVGYGIILYLMVCIKRMIKGRTKRRELPEDDALPDVTFLVCAYNEQDIVNVKMENIQQLNYPQKKLHVMWVTDGSSDNTNERLKSYPEVEIVYSPERRGKTAALNHGISQVKSEITVMTDANTMVNSEAIREIVRCMQDPKVGCVAGEKRVKARNEGEAAGEGEGLYWKYESALKHLDSELYSAMGAAGELNAIRTELYEPMPENALLDDFVMSMKMIKRGYKIAYTSDAYAMEYGSADMDEESKRKRRIAAGGLQSCWWLRSLMNPFRYPLVSFQFISHRVLRWSITPVAMFALIPINVALVMMKAGTLYTLVWIGQILFYLAAFGGYVLAERGHKHRLLYLPYYFLFMNINVFHGINYLRTHKGGGTWEKAKRG